MTHPLASVSVSQSIQNLLDTIFHSFPKILVFLAILVIGWIIAKVLARIVAAVLRKVHFDRFIDRGVVGQALSRSNYDAVDLLAKIVYYIILLVTLQLAFGVWGPNPISTMLNAIVGWLPKAFVAIVLVVIASAIAKVVGDLVGSALSGLSYGRFVAGATSVVIIGLGVIAALNQVGIAAAITQPILIAVLATAGAIVAIGAGGGLVRPMQDRWERILSSAERETTEHRAAYQSGREAAMTQPAGQAVPEGRQAADVTQGRPTADVTQGRPAADATQGRPAADATQARPAADAPGSSPGPDTSPGDPGQNRPR